MARNKYVDAERLRERYKRFSWSACMWVNDVDICDYLSSEDLEPVKHGHWVDMGDFEQCSCCHGTHLKEFQSYYGKATWIKTPYCHNCGARMDEVEDEEV